MKRKNIAAARSAGVSSAKSKVRKGTVKQVLRYVGKYPFSLSATLLLAIVTVGFTLYVPILIGDAMDCIVEAGKVDFFRAQAYIFQNRRFGGDYRRRTVEHERAQQSHHL